MRSQSFWVAAALLLAAFCNAAEAPRVYRDRVTAHWFASRFWYENQLPGGKREIVVINAETGEREIVESPPVQDLGGEGLKAELEIRPSLRNGPDTALTFENRRGHPVELFWIDPSGDRKSYGTVPPEGRRELHTFGGHRWLVSTPGGVTLGVFEATDTPNIAVIDTTLPPARSEHPREQRNRRESSEADRNSPDGKWSVVVKDDNLFLSSRKDDSQIQLTRDGKEGLGYGRISWSPDSKTFAAFQVELGERQEVYLVQSSPPGGGRAKLQKRPYALPGDKFPRYEVSVFDVVSHKQTKPAVDRYEHEYEPPRVHWRKDGSHFAYMQEDRGHQRLRVIDIDARDGSVRNLVDETTQTFIWTAHMETLGLSVVNWLDATDEMIYASEKSGWRHLYLVDAISGKMSPITTGNWVIRDVEMVDQTNRVIWFRASGVFAGQDPYLLHYGRVNFDGAGLTFLTESNGSHAITFSPDRKYIIDSYSRVDLAPANELRRVADGKLVCKLEEADLSELSSSGWKPPEVFVAKGRDGKTDIWGIICRPRQMEPGKKYPILEDIYAGPHGSFVPKTFAARDRYENWNDLGFIVVKIDGMGTANRSKAFQDVCWHNLKDGGFEDRILWMKAAAAKYPELDINRVGVYGTSAGGQNAAGAVLFHPEFYKAAIANCGCHDNRMDKASWNEQWMGYPVGPQYAECSNIDNAGRLRGALFLIVGELDTNVPPESTMRFVDALIRERKDFEFLVVPGADHGTRGPATPYVQRRMQDFFLRNLAGATLPNRNASAAD